LFACGFAAAFGALQLTPQMVPGLFKDSVGREVVKSRAFYEAARAVGKEDGRKLADLRQEVLALSAKAQAPSADAAAKTKAAHALDLLKEVAAVCREPSDKFPAKLEEYKKKADAAREQGDADADMMQKGYEGARANPNLGKAIGFLSLAVNKQKE